VEDTAVDADPTVVTGSHNWSNSAEFSNNENTLVIHSHDIAVQYVQEWYKRYIESGGTGAIVLGVESQPSAAGFSLTLYPSPLRAGDALTLQVDVMHAGVYEIAVNDMLGRKLRGFAVDAASTGRQMLLLPTSGLHAGSYIVSATDSRGSVTAQRLFVW
jgi:hypothetical protein